MTKEVARGSTEHSRYAHGVWIDRDDDDALFPAPVELKLKTADAVFCLLQAEFPLTTPDRTSDIIWSVFKAGLTKITWTRASHFMRTRIEWRCIFTLLALQHHGKLLIPYDVLEVLFHWHVIMANCWSLCKRCRGRLLSDRCMGCTSRSCKLIEYIDLVKYIST